MTRIVRASDQALLVVFGDAITREASESVRRLHAWLHREPVGGVVDLHPAYASLLVRFDPIAHDAAVIERALRERLVALADHPAPEPRERTIPVHYGGEDGPDLGEVARQTGLTPAEVIDLHAGARYEVAFVGFSPGFPYLSGLPARLATARRATPRRRVPAGSVAIAGGQAGIYPLVSPGGWNLIGRTDLVLFDARREEPAWLAPGDVVRFLPAERAS